MTPSLDLTQGVRWQFRAADASTRWLPARLPGCVHQDLQRAGLIPDPFHGTNELGLQWIEEKDWEYRGIFTLGPGWDAAGQIDLVADGLDTVATVSLNGHRLGRSDNMFVAHRWPARRWLRRGRNELHLLFHSARRYVETIRRSHHGHEFNDPVGGCTKIRKQQCQFGWDWGPRLVTAGVWRGFRLESWNGNRLVHVHVTQHHARDGSVVLEFAPELARPDASVRFSGTVSIDGKVVAPIERRKSKIESPRLWWPNGHGAQPLYTVSLVARSADGTELARWNRRIGLRTLALERQPDRWGESFRFVVNGRPIFAKGANWIPAHSFVAGLSRQDYARDLHAATQAHMNMIRVWGGGIYESEDFYDLCDELGLLVWQDFMFACSLYPGDGPFLRSVATEAAQQVRRLQHRACLALWCGNNEVYQLQSVRLKDRRLRRNYDAIFHRLLPRVVARHDGLTAYWPSSAWRGSGDNSHETGEREGDTHFWDVWHARQPVKAYEKWRFRFCSEFGMQSYSSPATNARYCPAPERNVFGPAMESHQKNPAGNQIILDYVSRRYRFPKNQDALILLSQLNQAHCMQVGVEHWRRHMPRCMGALYWQLNDCWPATSWSSLEFHGRWKALHYHARRFFAPALVTAWVPGDETQGLGNYRASDVRRVHLYTVYDAPEPVRGLLIWQLCHVDGTRLGHGRKPVRLRYGQSVRQQSLDLAGDLARWGRENLYLRTALRIKGREVSGETVFLTQPRFVNLPRGRAKAAVRLTAPTSAVVTFTSPVLLHRFWFDFAGADFVASDNFFDLHPGEPRSVTVSFSQPIKRDDLRTRLTCGSLVDTFE